MSISFSKLKQYKNANIANFVYYGKTRLTKLSSLIFTSTVWIADASSLCVDMTCHHKYLGACVFCELQWTLDSLFFLVYCPNLLRIGSSSFRFFHFEPHPRRSGIIVLNVYQNIKIHHL